MYSITAEFLDTLEEALRHPESRRSAASIRRFSQWFDYTDSSSSIEARRKLHHFLSDVHHELGIEVLYLIMASYNPTNLLRTLRIGRPTDRVKAIAQWWGGIEHPTELLDAATHHFESLIGRSLVVRISSPVAYQLIQPAPLANASCPRPTTETVSTGPSPTVSPTIFDWVNPLDVEESVEQDPNSEAEPNYLPTNLLSILPTPSNEEILLEIMKQSDPMGLTTIVPEEELAMSGFSVPSAFWMMC